MNLPRLFTTALLVLLLAACLQPAHAQDKAAQIDALLAKYHEYGQFNGAVLVAENGAVIYKKGFGDANMEWGVANTPATKFRIGSVTKQFTATLILQLMEEGKISLDGTITDYLPDYPPAQGDKVTIHHLLTHTSGIPSYTGLPGFMQENTRDPYAPDSFLTFFSSLDFEFEPGSEWRYNNSGYFLLGAIIEKVTGKAYDEVLRERILDPLDLYDTGYEHNDDVIPGFASGYAKTFGGYRRAPYLDTSIPFAAGMMYSTVEDLFKWNLALYTDQIFEDPETKTKMFTPYMNNYAYGWMVLDMSIGDTGDSTKVIRHGGGIFGFTTTFIRLVDDRHVIAMMDNTTGNPGAIAPGIVNILYGEPAEDPKQPISQVMGEAIEKNGVDAAIKQYHHLKESEPDAYDFAENQLNRLGYSYLQGGDTETAIAVFKLNVEMYPNAFNTYDSLGEAYMETGDNEKAIANYKKSIELNAGNDNGKDMLKKLGVELDEEVMTLSAEILDRYVGVYELQPGFKIEITREGTQLKAQATGQPQFDLFPQSETRFYLKVVDAQVEFHPGDDGVAESLTLFQGGLEMNGPRVEEGS